MFVFCGVVGGWAVFHVLYVSDFFFIASSVNECACVHACDGDKGVTDEESNPLVMRNIINPFSIEKCVSKRRVKSTAVV